jgi:excisionase family DNA binding protein
MADAIQLLLEWHGLMTVAQAAQFLKVQKPHLRKLLGEGRIKAFHVGGEWRINPSDLLIYLDERANR